jgi:hypothetical protein
MQKTNENQNFQFSSNIERGDNMPIVVSRYGFKEEIIDGKTYLLAMTKEEYLDALKNTPEIPNEHLDDLLARVNDDKATCYMYTTMACATRDNCQWCHLGNVGTSYYCYCKNWPW